MLFRSSEGLKVVDITDPYNPTEVNVFETQGDVIDVEIKDNYAFFTDGFEGLKVVDISDPLNIQPVGSLGSPFWFLGLKIEGDYAYVAAWEYGGLRIIDISDPANMKEVGYYITPGKCRDLDVSDGISYIANWDYGLGIVNNDLLNPIPVELVSFSVEQTGNEVQLSWITATEINNQGFEIEKKSANDDDWAKLGFMEGNGTTTEMHYYSFSDNISSVIFKDVVSYRLKQIDFDGSYEYSKVIEVKVNQPEKYSLEQNYPNPFNPSTKIKFSISKAGHTSLEVYNILGDEVATLVNEEKPAGLYEVEFNGENLSSGTYYYRFRSGTYFEVRKMILLK